MKPKWSDFCKIPGIPLHLGFMCKHFLIAVSGRRKYEMVTTNAYYFEAWKSQSKNVCI